MLASHTTSAHADLGLEVRAQSSVSLTFAAQTDGTRVRIHLVDDLGSPIASGRVSVALDATPAECAQTLELTSRRDGTAHALVPIACTIRGAYARFEGDGLHEAHEATLRAERARVRLDVRVVAEQPTRIDLDRPSLRVTVGASPVERARGMRVTLLDELARALGTTTLDAAGTASVEIATRDLAAPGPGTLAARIDDLEGVEVGRAEIPIVRFRAVNITLEARAHRAETELAGRVSDSVSAVGGATITLMSGETSLASAVTDVNGAFAFRIGSDRWPRGANEIDVSARYIADRPGRVDTSSPTLTLAAPGASARFDPRYLIPLAVGFAAWLWSRRSRNAIANEAIVIRAEPPALEHGVRPSLAPWAARLRDLDVLVLDRDGDGVVQDARVAVHARGEPIAGERADETGRARFPVLPDGAFEIVVTADGYAEARFTMRIPHRGEWSDTRIRLETLRSKARRALEPVADRVLVPPATFEGATLREVEHASNLYGGIDASLVAAIESASYGANPPSLDDVERFENGVRTFTASVDDTSRSPLR